jgi:hypothetical protein
MSVTAAAVAETVAFIHLIPISSTREQVAVQADILLLAELVQMGAAAAPAALALTLSAEVAEVVEVQITIHQAGEMVAAALDYMDWVSPAPPAARVVVAGEIHMVLVYRDAVVITEVAVEHFLARTATAPVGVVD